jgi:hypothetical protein
VAAIRSLAVIISSISVGHYSPRSFRRRCFRSTSETLGDFHPLASGCADRLESGVVDIAGLGDDLGKFDRTAARQIVCLRIIPFPDRARTGGQLDERLRSGRFLAAVAEGPAIGGNAQMSDVADPVAVFALLAQYVENVLTVCPGFHLAGDDLRSGRHVGIGEWGGEHVAFVFEILSFRHHRDIHSWPPSFTVSAAGIVAV